MQPAGESLRSGPCQTAPPTPAPAGFPSPLDFPFLSPGCVLSGTGKERSQLPRPPARLQQRYHLPSNPPILLPARLPCWEEMPCSLSARGSGHRGSLPASSFQHPNWTSYFSWVCSCEVFCFVSQALPLRAMGQTAVEQVQLLGSCQSCPAACCPPASAPPKESPSGANGEASFPLRKPEEAPWRTSLG